MTSYRTCGITCRILAIKPVLWRSDGITRVLLPYVAWEDLDFMLGVNNFATRVSFVSCRNNFITMLISWRNHLLRYELITSSTSLAQAEHTSQEYSACHNSNWLYKVNDPFSLHFLILRDLISRKFPQGLFLKKCRTLNDFKPLLNEVK